MTVRHEYVLDCNTFSDTQGEVLDVEIRPPKDEDFGAVAELMLDAYRGTIDYDGEDLEDARSEVATYFDDSRGYRPDLDASRVALRDGRLVSACLISSRGDRNQPLVAYVMTRTDQKRRGIGRALLTESVSFLCASGVPTVQAGITDGNIPSERLFDALGFERANP